MAKFQSQSSKLFYPPPVPADDSLKSLPAVPCLSLSLNSAWHTEMMNSASAHQTKADDPMSTIQFSLYVHCLLIRLYLSCIIIL